MWQIRSVNGSLACRVSAAGRQGHQGQFTTVLATSEQVPSFDNPPNVWGRGPAVTARARIAARLVAGSWSLHAIAASMGIRLLLTEDTIERRGQHLKENSADLKTKIIEENQHNVRKLTVAVIDTECARNVSISI